MEQAQQRSVNYLPSVGQVRCLADPQVLILEKEGHIARFLEFFLQKEGYTTAVVHERSRIIQGIRDCNPQVILLDLEGANGAGREVLNTVLANKHTDVSLIVMTKQLFDASTRRELLRSVDSLCAKPMAPTTLLERLTALGVHPASQIGRGAECSK